MISLRSRWARIGVAVVLGGSGLLAYEAVTQVAGAVPPPMITTGYAAYPVAGSIPASCATDGEGVVQGLRFFLIAGPAGQGARPAQWFSDPGGTATPYSTTRSARRFQTYPTPSVLPGDTVVALWDSWTPGCEEVGLSMPLKKTSAPAFDITDDQAVVREPNGPAIFQWCQSGTDPCNSTGVNRLDVVIPSAAVTCNFQLDLVIGAPLESVGPKGSYYGTGVRQQAQALGLGTFNVSGPDMLLDALNQGLGNCAQQPRIVIDKQWVGTGTQPPSNVPPGFSLTVTSSVSDTDPTVLSTATCTVVSSAFTCDYRDAADPSVPQGGLDVNVTSLLTVTETGFPGNTVDVTFPVGLATRFVNCPAAGGPCLFTLTNTPPPPDTVPTTTPSTSPESIPNTPAPTTTPSTSPESIPNTLPATGSSGTSPITLIGLFMLPIGAALVLVTRRRASAG